jgi:hypothetical protein
MKMYGGMDVYIHVFLTSALVGGEWSPSRPGRSTSEKKGVFEFGIGFTILCMYFITSDDHLLKIQILCHNPNHIMDIKASNLQVSNAVLCKG